MSLVIVPILVPTDAPQRGSEASLTLAREAKSRGADLIEWRVDALWQSVLEGSSRGSGVSTDERDEDPRSDAQEHEQGTLVADEASQTLCIEVTRSLLAQSPLACILTCRVASEGGHWEFPDALRFVLLEKCCDPRALPPGHAPAFVDIEWSSIAHSRDGFPWLAGADPDLASDKPRLLASLHDTRRLPPDLARRIAAMAADSRVSAIKAAYHARSLHDALDALHLAPLAGKPTIALAMGPFGSCTRLLAPKAGSLATFAALRANLSTASGQLTLDELPPRPRFRAISQATRVFGVIGWPVDRSLSPALHNEIFAHVLADAAYVRLPVAPYEDPQATDAAFRATLDALIEDPVIALCGASVTMPHKQRLAAFVRARRGSLDAPARATGVANTLIVHRDEHDAPVGVSALNTDALAFRDLLVLELGDSARHRTIAILGSGATARSATWAAAQLGLTIHVYARDESKAHALALEASEAWNTQQASQAPPRSAIHAHPMRDLPLCSAHVVVQCTPLGMAGTPSEHQSALPVHDMHSMPRHVSVIETVMHPERTPTIAAAAERGWRCIPADEIFIRQGVLQAEAWLKSPVDMQLAASIVRRALMNQVTALADGPVSDATL